VILESILAIRGNKIQEILCCSDIIVLSDHVIDFLLAETQRVDQELDEVWPGVILLGD
jgi:hypothetical protein